MSLGFRIFRAAVLEVAADDDDQLPQPPPEVAAAVGDDDDDDEDLAPEVDVGEDAVLATDVQAICGTGGKEV